LFSFTLHRIPKNISHSKKQSVKYYCMSSCKMPLFLSDLILNMKFLDRISKNSQKPNFINVLPVGA